ncbi:phage tail spike protein [Salinicoccus halitifaciens]|uniref:Phage minor structural protein n=1 Tax=Salinicoccus halitifaciens TaxID=1073415 RepID=A0ABV2E5T9_9STAP|nr:phage tail spike protein [Salinicoccus halitifaciens]MCD2137165.1 hypothetical protein [Salinicoccus halitifaciens]
MSQIHILDRYSERIKEVLSNRQNSKIVLDDLHIRNIENNSETFDFVIDYKASENIQERDRVLIPDEELGNYREFIVDDINIDTYEGEAEIKTTSSYLEDLQKAKPIEPQTIDQHTAQQAVEFALFNVAGWEVGDIEYAGFRTISWTSYNSPYEVLKIIANRFDLQLDFTIETNGNRVTRRYVHMREKTALFSGKEVRRGKDLADLQVQRNATEVVTALLCLAPEPEEEGQERLTTIVVDDEAQALYGNPREYIWGIYEPESDDSDMTLNRLKTLGRTELNKRNKPRIDYTIEAVYLDEFLDHERVLIGDKIRVKDDLKEPYFYVEAVVKEIRRSIFNPEDKTYTLGEIIEFTQEDITKRFEDLRALFTQRMTETRSNFDNIVTIIDTQVERRIFKQDTPPDNPINDQLWLDTSNPEKPILKRYFNGYWNTEIKAVTEASDIDAVTREEAMYEAVLSSLANIEVNHLTLLTEANQVKENQYINDSHRTTIDNNVQIVIETYDTLMSEVERFKEDRRLNLEQSNIIHQMMLDYSSAINELRETIVKTTEFAMDHLAYLQSQYSDEQYEGAMQEVASKFGLTFEDGVLRGDPRLAQDLEGTRLELEDKIESARNTLNDMIEEITGDSRNMIVGTSLIDESHFTVVGGYTILDDEELEYVRINKEDASRDEAFILFHNKMDYLAEETYTLALDFRSDVVDELDYIFLSTDSTKHILHDTMIPQPLNLEATGEWNRYYMQFTPTEDILRAQLKVGTDYTDDIVGEFDIRQIHLYKGTSEMAWQPAPEDNRQYITQLSREITKLENQLSTKMTRDDYDLLEGQIESVSTEVTQTAKAITQKADKSVVDTLNNTVTTHGTQIETHAEGIDKLIEKTEATDESLTVVTNKTNETAGGLEQTITKVTETESALEDAEKQIKQAQADIKTNAEEISTKLSTAQYNTDQEGIISSIDTATSERVQLAEEIKDKVTLTEYENYKVETGTLGDANRVLNITTDKKGKWLRLAMNAGNRASARFIIADRTSSQHGTVEFNASVFFNRANNAEFIVNSFAKMTSFPFTKARFLTKDTYDEQYLDLYFNPTRDSTNSISIWMKDNIQTTGWVLQDLPEAEIPHGYKATEYDINEEASTNGILRKHEASITNNGKEISLKASQEELDSVNKTLSEKQAELSLDAENIKGEVKGVSDRLSEVSTTVTQNKEEFDVSVRENTNKFTQIDGEMTEKVGKTEVVASINASTEGVKINGDKVDISAGSSIRIAIDDAKRYADNVSSTAESNAKKHADNKAKAAQEAAEEYALAQAKAERVKAESYADGEITKEEEARIADVKAKLKEAKDHANETAQAAEKAAKDHANSRANTAENNAKRHAETKANEAEKAAKDHADAKARAERIIAEAYADGKVTAEEEARIKDANAKLQEAKTHADTKAREAEIAAKKVANVAQDTADEATEKLDDMAKGGRNLLLDSGRKVSTSRYNIADYYLTEKIAEGTEVTVSFKAKLATTKTHFRLYNSGGSVSMGRNFYPSKSGEFEVYTYTFNWRVGSSNNTFLRLYHMPSATTTTSEVEWMKLEYGKQATGWSPAPEDNVEKKKIISEINLSDEAVKIKAEKVDIDGRTINIGSNPTVTSLNSAVDNVDTKATNARNQANAARDGNNIARALNASTTTVNIAASKINLSGYATFNDLSTSGRTTISGDNIRTGLLQSSNGRTSFNLNTGTISVDGGNGLIVKNSNSSRRIEMVNGEISSYAGGDLTMKFGGYNMEFYNHADDPIGRIQPIYSTGSSRPGLGIIAQSDVINIGYRAHGLYRAVLRSDFAANETVVSGPFNSANAGSTLRLYANRRIVSSDTDYANEYTAYDQPTIILDQSNSTNHITQYFGGVNNRNSAQWRVRFRTSTSTWQSKMIIESNRVRFRDSVQDWNGNEFYANGTGSNSLNRDTALHAGGLRTLSGWSHLYLGTLSGGEVRITNGYGRNQDGLGNGGITYRDLRAAKLYSDSVWSHQYDNYWVRTPSELRITSRGSTSNYRDIRFRNWRSVSSEKYKTDISEWNLNVLDILKDEVTIYQYKYKVDEEDADDAKDDAKDFYQRGLIVERNTPSEFVSGDGINQYEVISWALKGIQELAHENASLKEKLDSLEDRLRSIEENK